MHNVIEKTRSLIKKLSRRDLCSGEFAALALSHRFALTVGFWFRCGLEPSSELPESVPVPLGIVVLAWTGLAVHPRTFCTRRFP
jgi:hypothetical protein